MKKLISFSLVVVLSVLFNGLVYGADENIVPVSATDIWFPSGIAKWTYWQTDPSILCQNDWVINGKNPYPHSVDVWIEKGKYNVVQESDGLLDKSPFKRFKIDSEGNVLSSGFNDTLIWNFLRKNIVVGQLTVDGLKAIEKYKKDFKFSSDEWLLLPAQLKDGQEWLVISYEFNPAPWPKETYEIKGKFSNNVSPSVKTAALLGKKDGFCKIEYTDTEPNGVYCTVFVLFPGVGFVERWNSGGQIINQLIEIQVAQPVEPKGKMATTWGSIKTQ